MKWLLEEGKIVVGNTQIVEVLNKLLVDELTAVNQYMVHAAICSNWGYTKLHKSIKGQALDEMHHAEWLIDRILFLEGMPNIHQLNEIKLGKSVTEMIGNDANDEQQALLAYNDAIHQARECNDYGTSDLLSKILLMEEQHLDWAEAQREQIIQIGLENYLMSQIEA